ncbi:PDZ domain-containing protein [Actinospica sp. MGRD01-02]|uniref:endopeptidase La n=1 Tax=Actinospica acidithermotolerans TaxID=2828514 RepID=A0A941ECV1_9ACTN|nr:PDZ domain-containing protein [Actinospica acidithermotolerans]MBR7830405.1 PDZ domain-containing protein [Actinospica acidithermotolerans]
MPRRRAVTLAVSGTLLAGFAAGALFQPVPYAELTPGPTFNVLGSQDGTPLITITGTKTYPTTGELRMVTVGVSEESYQMPLGEAMAGWLSSDTAIVPKETIYPAGQTQQQSDAQNTQEMTDSQDSAVTAALAALDIKPTGSEVVVASVTDGGPAAGKLQAGDVIREVDGTAITTGGQTGMDQVTAAIKKVTPGAQVTFVISRDGKQQTVTTGTENSSGKAEVGISIESENVFPFSVSIQLDNVGGPSAGMMFALGIIDKLTSTNLTGGRIVAGTGTIDANGQVGAIGGIQMKTIGARDAGATVFLAPASNCAEAKANQPAGLELVKVNTLDDALNALADVREGKTPPLC